MDLLFDILADAAKDTLALVPFLLVTYLVLELLEHVAGDHVNRMVKRAGAAGPVVGSVLGIFPQCGFSAMGATLYAGRVITLGTLVAVFLSTSDEMLPMLLAERVPASLLAWVLGIKVAVALITGIAIDVAVRLLSHNARVHAALRRTVLGAGEGTAGSEDVIDGFAEAGESTEHIHRLCEQDRCGCSGPAEDAHDHDHGHERHHSHGGSSVASVALDVVRSAISHTVQVSLFIFLVTVVLVAVLETVGQDVLATFIGGNELLAVFASALVGLIPNCSASVVITQLYLEGVLGFAPLMAGLLVSAGVGYLVLFRTNRRARENVLVVLAIYLVAVFWGMVLMAFGC